MLDVSPFSKLKGLFYKEESRLRYLSEDEERRLLDACQGTLKQIVLVALNTGMRRGEIFNLKWSDIHNGFIYLTKTKTYMPRQIPINKLKYFIPDLIYVLEFSEQYQSAGRPNTDPAVSGIRRLHNPERRSRFPFPPGKIRKIDGASLPGDRQLT